MGRVVRFRQRDRSWWTRGLRGKGVAAFLCGIKLLLPYVDTCKLNRDGVMQCYNGGKLLDVSTEQDSFCHAIITVFLESIVTLSL